MKSRWTAVALLAAGTLIAAVNTTLSDAGKAWWSHILILADDSLEGRKAGSDGHRKAAQYVAAQFEKAGLQPAGTDAYTQPVPLYLRTIDEPNSTLETVNEGKAEPVVFGTDAILQPRGTSGAVVEADAVFVGYGLRIPENDIDDLRGLDLKGKVAVILRGAPKDVPGPLAAHSQSAAEQWKHLHAAGAIGIASIYNTQRSDIPWPRAALARLAPNIALAVPEMNESVGQQISIIINPASADRFFAGTGHNIAELMAADKAGQTLPKFPLGIRIRAKTSFHQSEASSQNVLGVLPGTDSKLKNEFIVYSAHLDHLGIGQPVPADPADRVYNGAMDNASGIASIIEAAKSLRGKKLKRSIIFAAVTAEEGGLLGSRYFATRPTVPGGQIVADLNTDMFLPIIPLKAITVFGLDESDLGGEFAQVAATFGLAVKADPEPQRNRFTRSDQYSFIRRGIPSLAFKFHSDPGTPEQEVMSRWLNERYHAPSDDIRQPVNIEGAVQFNKVMVAFVSKIANRPARPVWLESSFFRRFAQK